MTSRLTKDSRLTFVPGSPGVPSSPGSPAVPGYVRLVYETVCGYVGGVWVDAGYGNLRNIGGTYLCKQVPKWVSVPGVPATPAVPGAPPTSGSLSRNNNLGWNSGAFSIAEMPGDGYVEFSLSAGAVGVIAGLGNDAGAGYSNIEAGFYGSNGIAQRIEWGALVGTPFTYDDSTVFQVHRSNGWTYYRINGAWGGWTTATAADLSAPRVGAAQRLDVSMYSGGDILRAPALEATEGSGGGAPGIPPGVQRPTNPESLLAWMAALKFMPMAVAGGGDGYSFGAVSMLPLEVVHVYVGEGTAAFKPMRVAGGTEYAEGEVGFQPPVAAGKEELGIVPTFALGQATFPQLSATGLGLTGEIGGGTAALPPMLMLAADFDYGLGSVALEPLLLGADDSTPTFEGSGGTIRSSAGASGWAGASIVLPAMLRNQVAAASTVSWQLVLDAPLRALLVVEGEFDSEAQMVAALRAAVAAHASIPTDRESDGAWVVNLESGASTRYENFDFQGFAQIGEHYYGVRPDGLYRLEGNTDDGEPIRSYLALGRHDFGTAALKGVDNVYVGLASSGRLVLKVAAGGNTYTYRTERTGAELATQRIKTGRGLRATHFVLELFNEGGADFEMDSIEIDTAAHTRRI